MPSTKTKTILVVSEPDYKKTKKYDTSNHQSSSVVHKNALIWLGPDTYAPESL